MRRAADFGCENVEHDLDGNDEQNVEKTLLRLPNMAMAKKESGPRADDSHDAAGRADEFGGPNDFQLGQRYDAGGGTDSRNQIARGESHCADRFFQGRTKHVEREEVKNKMDRVVMQEKSSEESPELASVNDCVDIERAESMQHDRIVQCVSPQLDAIGGKIEQDENDD